MDEQKLIGVYYGKESILELPCQYDLRISNVAQYLTTMKSKYAKDLYNLQVSMENELMYNKHKGLLLENITVLKNKHDNICKAIKLNWAEFVKIDTNLLTLVRIVADDKESISLYVNEKEQKGVHLLACTSRTIFRVNIGLDFNNINSCCLPIFTDSEYSELVDAFLSKAPLLLEDKLSSVAALDNFMSRNK
ncbi:hypothetical protein D3C81_11720 [compost metagenome]